MTPKTLNADDPSDLVSAIKKFEDHQIKIKDAFVKSFRNALKEDRRLMSLDITNEDETE